MATREVVLVVEQSVHYYIEDPEGTLTEAEVVAAATEKLDKGEPDENPASGWLKVTSWAVSGVPLDPTAAKTRMLSPAELLIYFERPGCKPFTEKELAERWDNCSIKTIRRRRSSGEIRSFKPGRDALFTLEAVYEYEQKMSGNPL
jgi:hypothetical protein